MCFKICKLRHKLRDAKNWLASDLHGKRNPNISKAYYIYQGLSKHQEVCFTRVTKVKKMIVIFWNLLGAI